MINFRTRYRYYYRDIEKLIQFLVPKNTSNTSDYIVMVDEVGSLADIGGAFEDARSKLGERGRLILTFHNYLWEPLFVVCEALGLKARSRTQNWLSRGDVANLLYLSGFEVVRSGQRMLFPVYIPLVSAALNTVGRLPLINYLCITHYIVARPTPAALREYSVSIIVPARNEKGNIEELVRRTPHFGSAQEIIFVEGHSRDGTWEEIERVAALHGKGKRPVRIARQEGMGKGDAVRKGFALARNELLMILDADMTVAPEDLVHFYNALARGRADFINGSRLVYPMEKQAMRFLNTLGNKFFALLFTWLLGQPIKDTLCGTKVLLKSDYERIASARGYFGDFDPFGDFDLLFGAVKQNLKIIDLPIRYRERRYGSTQIQRFAHGWLLLKMSFFAARKLKFN